MNHMANEIEKIEQGEKAHIIHQNIVETKKTISSSFLRLGYLFKTAHDQAVYRTMGYDNWEQYLSTPEVSVSGSTASRLMNIYEVFVLEYKFPTSELEEIDISKLFEILPIVKRLELKQDVEGWLDKARELGVRDLRIEKKSYYLGTDPKDCKHENTKEVHYWRCNNCGEVSYTPFEQYE